MRVGIIGIGFGQSVHLPAFRSHPRCSVEAVCASTLERAREVAARHGIPRPSSDWHALVADPGIDALALAVPPALQAEIVPAAAAAGKHVFCEKPLSVDARAACAMADAVRAAGVVHAIDFEFPELPSWQRAHRLIEEGALGRLRHASLVWHVETRAHRERLDTWKVRGSSGGGTLQNFVTHTFHYMEWFFGPIRRLAARLEGAPDDVRVDAWLEHASGLPATLSVAADAFLGPGHRLTVYGERGTLVLENTSADYIRNFVLSLGTRENGRLEPVVDERSSEPADGRVLAVGSLARRFVDAILTSSPFRPNLDDGARVQRLVDAARHAAQVGGWVEP